MLTMSVDSKLEKAWGGGVHERAIKRIFRVLEVATTSHNSLAGSKSLNPHRYLSLAFASRSLLLLLACFPDSTTSR